MGFAVFHPSKGTGTGGGTGHHIDRTPGHEHTYEHVDSSRRELNINRPLQGEVHKLPLSEAINQRIKQGYQGKKAIRKDAVKFLSLILSGSNEDMVKLASNPALFKKWQQANYDFVAREFGGEANIMRFTLHMDEKTPHIHAIVVPLTDDGRLSAKEMMGNSVTLSKRQDRYAEAMEPFGLIRGVVGSKAKHNSEGWYLGQQKQALESPNKAAVPELGPMDRLSPQKYNERVKTLLTDLQKQNTDLQIESNRRLNQVKAAQANQKKAEEAAASQKAAVQSIAQQLMQSGKEGVKLNASYALNEAPAAIQEAASALFQTEVRKFAAAALKPHVEFYYRGTYDLGNHNKSTKAHYEHHQEYDSVETRKTLAASATRSFSHLVNERLGREVGETTPLYRELRSKVEEFMRELAKNIAQELRAALGIEEPLQQKNNRGISR